MKIFNKETLLFRISNDIETYRILINHATALISHIDAIAKSVEEHDDDSFKRELFKLKSASLTLHFERLSHVLRMLEFCHTDDREDLCAIMKREWECVSKIIDEENKVLG